MYQIKSYIFIYLFVISWELFPVADTRARGQDLSRSRRKKLSLRMVKTVMRITNPLELPRWWVWFVPVVERSAKDQLTLKPTWQHVVWRSSMIQCHLICHQDRNPMNRCKGSGETMFSQDQCNMWLPLQEAGDTFNLLVKVSDLSVEHLVDHLNNTTVKLR